MEKHPDLGSESGLGNVRWIGVSDAILGAGYEYRGSIGWLIFSKTEIWQITRFEAFIKDLCSRSSSSWNLTEVTLYCLLVLPGETSAWKARLREEPKLRLVCCNIVLRHNWQNWQKSTDFFRVVAAGRINLAFGPGDFLSWLGDVFGCLIRRCRCKEMQWWVCGWQVLAVKTVWVNPDQLCSSLAKKEEVWLTFYCGRANVPGNNTCRFLRNKRSLLFGIFQPRSFSLSLPGRIRKRDTNQNSWSWIEAEW